MKSWIYTEGFEAGFQQGIEQAIHPLARQFERRLGRPLTEAEQSSLRNHFQVDEPEKVGHALLDLSPQDLALWLAPTNGH